MQGLMPAVVPDRTIRNMPAGQLRQCNYSSMLLFVLLFWAGSKHSSVLALSLRCATPEHGRRHARHQGGQGRGPIHRFAFFTHRNKKRYRLLAPLPSKAMWRETRCLPLPLLKGQIRAREDAGREAEQDGQARKESCHVNDKAPEEEGQDAE